MRLCPGHPRLQVLEGRIEGIGVQWAISQIIGAQDEAIGLITFRSEQVVHD